jgi:hypothetical protein
MQVRAPSPLGSSFIRSRIIQPSKLPDGPTALSRRKSDNPASKIWRIFTRTATPHIVSHSLIIQAARRGAECSC